MELKTGHFYVRNKWSKEYGFLRISSDNRGAFYTLNETLSQRLERGTADNLDQFEVVKELPWDYQPGFHEVDIRVTAKSPFGHVMEFGAKNLLRFSIILEKIPGLAKALDINGARSYKRKQREGHQNKK